MSPKSKKPIPKTQHHTKRELAEVLLAKLEIVRQDWLLTQEQLATLIELHPQTLADVQADPSQILTLMLNSQIIERMEDLLRIAFLLDVLFEKRENAYEWVNKPNSAPLFGGQTALDFMLANPRDHRSKVIAYLLGVCSGDFS